jgi:NAD(P)H dehydrogenase (quinone)
LALAAGKWHTASGKGRVGYVSREDFARAAAAALYAPTRTSTWFDITGPELLSAAQVVAMVRDLVRGAQGNTGGGSGNSANRA